LSIAQIVSQNKDLSAFRTQIYVHYTDAQLLLAFVNNVNDHLSAG